MVLEASTQTSEEVVRPPGAGVSEASLKSVKETANYIDLLPQEESANVGVRGISGVTEQWEASTRKYVLLSTPNWHYLIVSSWKNQNIDLQSRSSSLKSHSE